VGLGWVISLCGENYEEIVKSIAESKEDSTTAQKPFENEPEVILLREKEIKIDRQEVEIPPDEVWALLPTAVQSEISLRIAEWMYNVVLENRKTLISCENPVKNTHSYHDDSKD